MPPSYYESPKGPHSFDNNFQELKVPNTQDGGSDIARNSRDFLTLPGLEAHSSARQHPSMVSGPGGERHHPEGIQATYPPDRFAGWTSKTKIGRRRVSRALKLTQVRELESAWHHARRLGQPMNKFITFRPQKINDQNPEQRIHTWTAWRNKLAQFARDHGFAFTCLWTRESERHSGRNEHMHVLMHVPPRLWRRFNKVVKGWCDGTEEIDVTPCDYRTRTNKKGGQENILTYVTKNSPQAGRFLGRTIQLGGPILGNRYGLSRNLTARARAQAEVAGVLRRDLGLVVVTSGASVDTPSPANDTPQKGNGRRAA